MDICVDVSICQYEVSIAIKGAIDQSIKPCSHLAVVHQAKAESSKDDMF